MFASSLRHRSPVPGPTAAGASGAPFALLAALLAAVAAGCGHAPPPRADKTVEVVVTTPVTGTVLDYQDTTGRLEAFRSVDIRARVTGYVNEAPFKEGEPVRKGDLLFQVEERPYRADLDLAEANLKLATAERNLQDLTSVRARRLYTSRTINKEEYDQNMAGREKSDASVGAMEAAREKAAVFMGYTKVKAPISGRVSRRYVDPGNLVKADDTLLTTIVADDPIYAYFDVDERTYLDLVGEKSSESVGAELSKLRVLLRLANEEEPKRAGAVDFLDNRLNGNTGTIRLRAVFKNTHGTLKPGLFVRVRVPIGSPYSALLIPDEALQSDQGRKYVYVVDAEDKVEYRSVKFGQAIQGLRVITEGLKGGERVIISGMQRARPKLTVKANMQAPPRVPEPALHKLPALERAEAVGEGPPPPALPSGVRKQRQGTR